MRLKREKAMRWKLMLYIFLVVKAFRLECCRGIETMQFNAYR